MKFRAKLSKDCLIALYNVILNLEKISSNAILFLNETSIRISLLTDSIDTTKCYTELNVHKLFLDYRIESQSSNTILFEIKLNQLSKALLSGKLATQSFLKLVKRDNKPYLSFETKANESILSVDVVHDIPIKLMKSNEIIYHLPPEISPPSVILDIPRGKLLKTILEKLTKFSKYVYITACQSGQLILKVEHPSVTVKTYYNGLQSKYIGNMNPITDCNNQVTNKLNLKKISSVVSMSYLPFEYATLCKNI